MRSARLFCAALLKDALNAFVACVGKWEPNEDDATEYEKQANGGAEDEREIKGNIC